MLYFSIAKSFDLKPETILWANYDQLKDSPDALIAWHAAAYPAGEWGIL